MVRGVTTGGGRGQGEGLARFARRTQLARLALLLLAGCGSAQDAADAPGLTPGWTGLGGQTGSLMPRCGLAPVARTRGVPSSASGIVVYTSACGTMPQAALALFDADGNPVPVQIQPLSAGVVLVTPQTPLTPGSYVLGSGAVAADAGVDAGSDTDADAGVGTAGGSDPGASVVQGEPLSVLAPSAPPARLGELHQLGGACGSLLELALDPGIEPYLPSLALDLRVDGGAPRRLVEFGTLDVTAMGTAQIAIPEDVLTSPGPYAITLEGVLAGDSVAIEPATLEIECDGPPAQAEPESDGERGCGVICAGPPSSGSAPWLLAAVTFLAWRRRRHRPPD